MTFVSMSKYLLILGTHELSELKYCQYLIIMGFSMSILIWMASVWGTQTTLNFCDFFHVIAFVSDFFKMNAILCE